MAVTAGYMIGEDCIILMERAFLGKKICAFGEDGNGAHGRHEHAMWFDISFINGVIRPDNLVCPKEITGQVTLTLDGYDASKHGLILTDNNFEICMRQLLKNAHIDPTALKWAALSEQGNDFVALEIDVPLLIGWP